MLQHIDVALSLLPPLKKGEMPDSNKVLARVYRAIAFEKLGDTDHALLEFRIRLAAIRLLDHSGKVDMSDETNILIEKTLISLTSWSS